jgi:hypothetical protein
MLLAVPIAIRFLFSRSLLFFDELLTSHNLEAARGRYGQEHNVQLWLVLDNPHTVLALARRRRRCSCPLGLESVPHR